MKEEKVIEKTEHVREIEERKIYWHAVKQILRSKRLFGSFFLKN